MLNIVKEEAQKAGKGPIDDALAKHILWEYTGFPCFWNTPEDGKTAEECVRTQAKRFFNGEVI